MLAKSACCLAGLCGVTPWSFARSLVIFAQMTIVCELSMRSEHIAKCKEHKKVPLSEIPPTVEMG